MEASSTDAATLAGPVGWALAGGALIIAHLWAHPLAREFRESLVWLSRRPFLVLATAASIALQNWNEASPSAPDDISYHRWSSLLWECLEKGVHRFAWLFHDIMHRGALYHVAALLLAVVLVFRVKCFQQERTTVLKRVPTVLSFLVLIAATATMLMDESGWMKMPGWVQQWVPLPAEAITLAVTQVFFSRLLIDSHVIEHSALPSVAETSRRWSSLLALGAFDLVALWMEQSNQAQMPLLRRWMEPEFLLFISLLPLVIAGTKYPFLHCGGFAVTLLCKLWSSFLSIAASAVVMFGWMEFAMLAARHYFAPAHQHLCIIGGALVCALAQCWLFVTCGLLLLRSGYLQPAEPPSSHQPHA